MSYQPTEEACLAWLAEAYVPAESLKAALEAWKSGSAVLDAVRRQDEAAAETIPESALKRLQRNDGEERFRKYETLIREHGIRVMTSMDSAFPQVLTQIRDPASILFYQGNPECLKSPVIGMFGSRAASWTGRRAARRVARELSGRGIRIASGFAYGIDTEAHTGCVEGGSPTIAVMGGGLDQLYPRENEPLKKQLLDGGGVMISEYAPGMRSIGRHFPYRNRITSAISDGLVLIEAKIRSGSMTTVAHALDQGKELFVFPGEPDSPLFEGNHILLREGARIFLTAEDILDDMGWLDNPAQDVQNNVCSVSGQAENETERRILGVLERGPAGFEQIAALTGIPAQDLLGALTMMQIRGTLEALPGKKYQIRR